MHNDSHIVKLGRELAELVSTADSEAPGEEFDAKYDELKQALAGSRAATLLEAEIHAIHLVGDLDELGSNDLAPEYRQLIKRAKRWSHSILTVLEMQTGWRREEFGGDFCASRRLNPFAKKAD